MGMAAPTYYTADMVRALPDDGNRYEVVHGELLVTTAPRAAHQYTLGELFYRIGTYARAHVVGQLFTSPADISWGPDILVQPDLFVVRAEEARTFDWARMKGLLLAIEVLSPSSRRADRFTKRRLYQEVGVPLYWMVDIEARAIEAWTPKATFPTVERERVAWHPAAEDEPLIIPIPDILPPAGIT